jgi:hypothetical protein
MKNMLGDLIKNLQREDISKPKIWNGKLHEVNNDNGVRLVKYATLK